MPYRPAVLLCVFAFVAAAMVMPCSAAPYGLADALRELHDLSLLESPANPPRRAGHLSSADSQPTGRDAGNFLRVDGEELVLMDVRGPGVLTRLWTSEPMGYLRFYFDGAMEPQFSCLWYDLATGAMPPLSEPFVAKRDGGCSMRFPLPFGDGLKITVSGQAWCDWAIDYSAFAAGTEVTSWWPSLGPPAGIPVVYTHAADAWEGPGLAAPRGEVIDFAPVSLFSGGDSIVYTPSSGVMVTEVSFEQLDGGMIGDDLLFELVQTDGTRMAIPLASLLGEGGGATLVQGGVDSWRYFRIPFWMDKGDRLKVSSDAVDGRETIGRFRLRVAESQSSGPRPRLITARGNPWREAVVLPGSTCLLSLYLTFSPRGEHSFLLDDPVIESDGDSLHGTSIGELFDTVRNFGGEAFAAPLSAMSRGGGIPAGYVAFLPAGIFAEQSVSLRIEANSPGRLPERAEAVLIGQRFAPATEGRASRRAVPASVKGDIGARVTAPGPDDGQLPVYTEFIPPVSVRFPEHEAWAPLEGAISGTGTLAVHSAGLAGLRLSLDLPFGWKGTFTCADMTQEVFDIGWPWFEYDMPTTGTMALAWEVRPPPTHAGGDFAVQVRAEARFGDGTVYTDRRVVTVHLATAGETAVSWDTADFDRESSESISLRLPDDFEGRPGDSIVIEAIDRGVTGDGVTTATLSYAPIGALANDRAMPAGVIGKLPQEGLVYTTLRPSRSPFWMEFPAGRYQSWLGRPRSIEVSLEESEDSLLAPLAARLYRRIPPPPVEGWHRRVPYVEWPEGRFVMPAAKAVIQRNELRPLLIPWVATPEEKVNPQFRKAEYLENIESGPMVWRVAETPYRQGFLRPSHAFAFRSSHIGDRLRIEDPRIAGARTLGLEFGFGPRAGTVGVRDCEGRLVLVQDLFLNESCTVPQWTWIALTVPSRDPWIYLELIGLPPGSLDGEITIQKILIDPEMKPQGTTP